MFSIFNFFSLEYILDKWGAKFKMETESPNNTNITFSSHDEHSRESDQDAEITVSNAEFLALAYRSTSKTEINEALSKLGVNVNYQDENGDTALHLSVRSKNDTIVDLLIKRGADSEIQNKKGKTAVTLAQERLENNPDDVRLLSIISLLNAANPGSSSIEQSSLNSENKSYPGSSGIEFSPSNSTQTRKRKGQYQYGNTPKRPKMDLVKETIAVSGLKQNLHGAIYQSKLLALYVKRGLDVGFEFLLATEMDEAEKFDDIVLKFKASNETDEETTATEADENPWTYRFMQAKHKDNPENKKMSIPELKSRSNDKDFSLQKYFISFCKIKNKPLFEGAKFIDFTIITNTGFDFIKSYEVPKSVDENELKKWRNYFESVEEKELLNDPILKIDSQKYKKIKPKQFKFNENAQSELIDLFKLNLLISALESKEISRRPYIGYKLKMINNESQFRRLEDNILKANNEKEKINSECNGKRRITYIQKMTAKFLKIFDGYFVKDTGEQANSSNRKEGRKDPNRISEREPFLDTALKETIEKSLSVKVKVLGKDSQKYLDSIKTICSSVENILNNVEIKLREYKENCRKYYDSTSDEFERLESEKEKLNSDELLLIKLKKAISESSDLKWIKEQTRNDLLKFRISKQNIQTIQAETDLFEIKQNLIKKLDKSLSDISIIKVALGEDTFSTHVKDFIEEFRIVTEYPNENDLSQIIRDEINEEFSLINADLVSDSYERKLIEFLKEYNDGKGRFLSGEEGYKFFEQMRQQINSMISIGLCVAHTEKLNGYGIRFWKNVHGLKEFLLSKYQVLHVSCEFTRLSAIKIYRDIIDFKVNDTYMFKEDNSYIFVPLGTILDKEKTREYILNSFESRKQSGGRSDYDLCVIEYESQQNVDNFESLQMELYKDLFHIISENASKKIILITHTHDKSIEIFQKNTEHQMPQEFYMKVNDTISFNDLDHASRDIVLGRKVIFQGQAQKISLNKLIDKRSAFRVIDPENLLRLIERDEIRIGNGKVFDSIGYVEDYYVDRYFNREENSMDRLEDLREIELIGSDAKMILLANNPGMGKSTVLTSIARKIHKLSEYKWILRINLNDYAGHYKNVVNLSKVTFKEADTTKCIDFLPKMIVRGNEKTNANVRLQRSLLKVGLTVPNAEDNLAANLKKPQIILFLDGFDEISPGHRDKTMILINTLAKTNANQLWVTTRTHEFYVDNEFPSFFGEQVYYLQPLVEDEQKKFINDFWIWHMRCFQYASGVIRDRKYREIIKYLKNMKELLGTNCIKSICDIIEKFPLKEADDKERYEKLKSALKELSLTEYVDKLLSNWNEGKMARDKNFHSNPLNLKMLTEVVIAKNNLNIITNFELLFVYEMFIDIQFNIYDEKSKKIRGNQAAEDKSKRDDSFWNLIHKTLAIKKLFPGQNQLPSLMSTDKLDKFKEQIKSGERRSKGKVKGRGKSRGEGIDEERGEEISRFGLLNIRCEQLDFIHPSFAEYFLSKYLIEHFNYDQVQKMFIENILLENTYGTVRQFFNDLLKKSKNIVLNEDAIQLIDRNLKNSLDKHVLKLIAKEENFDIFEFLIKNIRSNEDVYMTLKKRFNLNDEDEITINVVL